MFDDYVLGIDLGTSNSSAAIMEDTDVLIIPNDLGNLITPSYVTFLDEDKILVGELSKLNILSGKNTIFDSKRLIGKYFSDKSLTNIKKKIEEKLLPFEIKEEKDTQKIKIGIEIKEKRYFYPELISSFIIKKLKEDAEYYLSKKEKRKIEIKKTVISIPANYNQIQRKATKQAAEIANLEVIGMINEPTAASLAYGLIKLNKEDDKKKIIILDIGGGTIDFTLLNLIKNSNGVYCDVEGSIGDPHFGGEDFDLALMKEIIKDKNNIDKNEYLRIKLSCEKAKIELSDHESAKIVLEEFDINKTITKNDFLKIGDHLFQEFKNKLRTFIDTFKIKKQLISDIILIGGATKMPKIIEILKEEFPTQKLRNDIDPNLSVAKGAAIRASMIEKPEEYCYINLLDVTNLSLGTNVLDQKKQLSKMDIIIKRSTELPAYKEKEYKTCSDNQTTILNKIYEGESEDLSENLFLGSFEICNLPAKPKGDVKIKMSFSIDKDSLLEVKATELSNLNNTAKIIIKEKEGIKENELIDIKNKVNQTKIMNIPGYNDIKDDVLRLQEKINFGNGELKDFYLDLINDLVNIDYLEENIESEEIYKKIYIPYIKYIFSLAKILFKDYNVEYEIFKIKYRKIFLFIQFLDDRILFELLEDMEDNTTIYQYFLAFMIENYNSKMKQLYFDQIKKLKNDNIYPDFKKCRNYLKINQKLLKKINDSNVIEQGIKAEIDLYEIKFQIQEFLVKYKKGDINKSDSINIALGFEEKIIKNISFFHTEKEDLSNIVTIQNEKYDNIDDSKHIYNLVKFSPPVVKFCPYGQIKSEKDIEEEIMLFIKNFQLNPKNILEVKDDNEKLFFSMCINSQNGLNMIDKSKIPAYKKKRLFQEERRRKINDNYFNKFNKYIREFYHEVEYYFKKDPYGTIIDLVSIYQNDKNKNSDSILYLNYVKVKYREIKDELETLKNESNENNSLFLISILKKYPPYNYIYSRTRLDKLEIRDNENYRKKIDDVTEFYQKNYDTSNTENRFKYFKDYCEIYFISYIVSHYTKREYLSIIIELKNIREEFANEGYTFDNIYEKKILDPNGYQVLCNV